MASEVRPRASFGTLHARLKDLIVVGGFNVARDRVSERGHAPVRCLGVVQLPRRGVMRIIGYRYDRGKASAS
jgi:hypothetical protein